ncbi:MAG TPA: dCTP deaminase [Candidatus Paceibacterota bacterium]|nr:dCTP deaminase [Candidatus Paceibacterota bacterium]
MILTRTKIADRIAKGSLKFTPGLDMFQLRPHAVDLRLGYTFLLPKSWHMTAKGREALSLDHFDKKRPQYFEALELEQGQYFELLPGEYVIVSTLEKIVMPKDLMAVLYPRSSVNRKGLSVDLTGIVDCGYEGQLAVPVRNNTSHQIIRLYPGERFCQLVFEETGEEIEDRTNRYSKKDIIEGAIRSNPGLGGKDEEEMDLIQGGKIKELKEKFKI